jgi:hypothetical protein
MGVFWHDMSIDVIFYQWLRFIMFDELARALKCFDAPAIETIGFN